MVDRTVLIAGLLASVSASAACAQTEELSLPSRLAVPLTLNDPLWNAPPADPESGGVPLDLVPQFSPPGPTFSFRDALRGAANTSIHWFLPGKWDSSWQVGINGSRGNADANSFRTGLDLSRETVAPWMTDWDIQVIYAKNEAAGVETQHNALVNSVYDWKLALTGWSVIAKSGLEYDEFKNFDIRLWLNSGLGYLLVDSPMTELRSRVGSGASREVGGSDEGWLPEALFGLDLKHQISEKQKLFCIVDHYPSWADFSDYRIIANFGWEVVINQKGDLSVQVNLIDRYDSTPNGARPNDVDYALVLIWAL